MHLAGSSSKKLAFQFDPGTKRQYSGEGFEYLRHALENKFHKSLNQLATELIFTPLKMYDTKYFWDRNTDSSRFATAYDKDGNPYAMNRNKTSNAADLLQTTIEDYGKFLVNVLQGDGLSKKVARRCQPHRLPPVMVNISGSGSSGMISVGSVRKCTMDRTAN